MYTFTTYATTTINANTTFLIWYGNTATSEIFGYDADGGECADKGVWEISLDYNIEKANE